MLDGFFGALIKTPHLDKLKKFYAEKLEMQVLHSCANCAILKFGDKQRLILQKAADVKTGLADKAPVVIGFSTPDVAALHKKLSKAVKFSSPPKDEDWGASIASAADPDGNGIVFVQQKPELAKAEFCAADKEAGA